MKAIDEDLTPLLDSCSGPWSPRASSTAQQLFSWPRLAARFETQPQLITRPLTGKILISAFYEPSTRTRLSFESAWHRLGGDIMSITDPASTGIAKGESSPDIGEMLNSYGDLVVLRDSDAAIRLRDARDPAHSDHQWRQRARRTPDAGTGRYLCVAEVECRLAFEPGTERDLRIGIIGVPARMRTVRSLLLLLVNFPDNLRTRSSS